MPNRIIRPGINNSPRVNALGIAEELFFRRLFAVADDYGIFELNFDSLLYDLYPLKTHEVTVEDLKKWWSACVNVNLVREYQARGRVYGVILNFNQHARVASQYPPPPADSGLILCKSSNTAKAPSVGFRLKSDLGELSNIENNSGELIISKKNSNKNPSMNSYKNSVLNSNKNSYNNSYKNSREFKSTRAVTPSPNEVPISPEIRAAAEEIREIHPRKRAQRDDVAAIANAIQRESEKSGETVQNVIERLKLATKQYAAAVSNWPPEKQCFIKSCKGWFDEGYYHENPEQWKQYDKSNKPSNGGKYVPRH